MDMHTMITALGGLALFLLAMQMMTSGLKIFAGGGLRQLLGRWTSSPLRGVFAGILVTGLVQSSSAVTVATIGFVNAGLLTLRQALGVVFGSNVGTTVTSWLVSLVGFGFSIQILALPMLTVGVALRLAAPGRRFQGLGDALTGFGIFFMGLAILRDAFSGFADVYGAALAGGGPGTLPAFLLAGFIATVLTQSSSASIAIILTAVTGGVIPIDSGAAAIIGASLGTTSTAAVAVIRATPAAKRLALGHIIFNVITGAVALALIPLLMRLAGHSWAAGPAVILALYHTVFKVLGVAIMLPFANRLGLLLEKLFCSAAEDISRPQHLDATLAATPVLAVSALRQELLRLRAIVTGIISSAVSGSAPNLEPQVEAVHTLCEAINVFAGSARTETMPEDVGRELARALYTARYLQEAARLAPSCLRLRQQAAQQTQVDPGPVLKTALRCLELAAQPDAMAGNDMDRTAALDRFQLDYKQTKDAFLFAAAGGRLSVEQAGTLLDALSLTRRMVEQLVKGDRVLRTPARAAEIDAEAHPDTLIRNADEVEARSLNLPATPA